MINWIKKNKKGIIRFSFLIPIILVMIVSISHVVSWYDLSNPLSWSIYLSIAIEVAAMTALSAATVRINSGVWFVFIIVTLIQFIGNVYFSYTEININSKSFKDWVELTSPIFDALGSDTEDMVSQKRWLALLTGGLLPIISLASLHFFIKYDGKDEKINNNNPNIKKPDITLETPSIKKEVINDSISNKLTDINSVTEENDGVSDGLNEGITEGVNDEIFENETPLIEEEIITTPEVKEQEEDKKKVEPSVNQVIYAKKKRGGGSMGITRVA